MKEQKIVWTLLPNGVTKDGNLLLSLYCAPQLKTNEHLPGEEIDRPTLRQFKELWEDWPAVLEKLKFEVKFFPGGPSPKVTRVGVTPSSEYWKQLFPLDMFVRPFEFTDMSNQNIYSFPVGNIKNYLQSLYAATAGLSPTQFPSKLDLWEKGQLGKISFFTPRNYDFKSTPNDQYHKLILAEMGGRSTKGNGRFANHAVPPALPNTTLDFFQLSYFHSPKSKPLPDKPYTTKFGKKGMISGGYEKISDAKLKKPDGKHDQTDLDFHQVYGSLGDHPELMRHLGVVIDLEVSKPPGFVDTSVNAGLPAVQVEVVYPPSVTKPQQVFPKTVYIAHSEFFVARPRHDQPDFDDLGLMRLKDKLPNQQNSFEIVQFDIDGGALKLMNTAYNMVQAEYHRTMGTPDDSSLPTLQSAGFSIARTGAAMRMASSFQEQTSMYNAGNPEPTLFAEDVTRGYRMDVYDSRTNAWHSLYQRVGTYDFKTGTPLVLEDEGFTQLVTTQAADGYTDDLFMHESFVHWNGWSLVAPKPGNAMDNDGVSLTPDKLNPTNPYIKNFRPSFKVKPRSLPGLRFGLHYRLRVRGVDLAGRSTSNIPEASMIGATDSEMYMRFEPVSSPTVVLRDDLAKYKTPKGVKTTSPGESLERLVIRTFNDDASADLTDTTEKSTRHFAPPKVGITLAEHHGKLDLLYTAPDWASKDDSARATIYKDQFQAILKRADSNFDVTKGVDSAPFPPPLNAAEAAAAKSSAGASNPIFSKDHMESVPYLPDPLAAGVTFINLPGLPPDMRVYFPNQIPNPIGLSPHIAKENVTQVDFPKGTNWFDVGAFRLELRDGTESGKSVTGHATPLKWDDSNKVLTVFINKADVWEVPYSSFLDTSPLELGDTNPDRTKRAMEVLAVWEWVTHLGIPASQLSEIVKFIEMGRAWLATPNRKLVLVHAVQKPLLVPAFNKLTPTKYLGDTFATLADQLTIDGKSTGKIDIRAHWDEPIDDLRYSTWQIVKGTTQVVDIKVEDPRSTALALYHHHNFGDTKHRMVNYTAVGSTRFREYFDPSITADEKNIALYGDNPAPINILNSKRPTSPDLLYIVPLFGWERPPSKANGTMHKRRGNALRVYMNRPWFNSGEGEELGVMIWTDDFNKIPAKYVPYVTQWGADPIWVGGAPTGSPSIASFPRAKDTLADVTLDELPNDSLILLETIMFDTKMTYVPPAKKMSNALNIELEKDINIKNVPPPTHALKQVGSLTRVKPSDKSVAFNPILSQIVMQKPALVVVGHEVAYDQDRQLWCCDIEIDAGPSYTPFVRLALTRFQPNSVDNAHISRVIIADFAQLLPDRNVAVFNDPINPKVILVAISGRTYLASSAELVTGKVEAGSEIEVSVEVARPDITDEGEALRWAPIPDSTFQLQSQIGKDGVAVWSSFINLPEPRSARKYRLLIKEFERFASDVTGATARAKAMIMDGGEKLLERRVVFADTIEL